MKKLKWIALAIVLVIILGVGIVWIMLDGIVRSTVETQATSSLNLKTTLGAANISLLGGSVGLKNLEIASPAGFTAPQMFSLGGINVLVGWGQLRQQPIHVSLISIDQPKLVIEQKDGKVNVQTLAGEPSKEPAPTPSGSKESIRLIIDKLQVAGANVIIRPGIPGAPEEIPVTVPSVDLENIGNGDGNKNGVAIKEVAVQTMNAIAAKAADQPGIPPAVKALLSGGLDKLPGEVNAKVDDALKALKSGDKDALKEAGKSLKGLLKDPTKNK